MIDSGNHATALARTFLYGAHVRANGIRQHYLRFGGRGRTLIVIPGITTPAATWGFVGERFARDFDTYVLDARGRGLSQGGAQLSYSLDTYADDVAALIEELKLGPSIILGHSMGGRIAARLGSRKPGAVARLILADPPLSGPGRRPYGRSLEFYLEQIRQAQTGGLSLDAMRQAFPTWSEEQLRLRAEWLHTCDEAAVAASHRGFHDEEIHSDLAAIRAPTLLIVAGKGGVILDSDIEEVRRLMPRIVVEKVERAGHQIPFDDFASFVSVITAFLQQV